MPSLLRLLCVFSLGLASAAHATTVSTSWDDTLAKARGQTVYFNAWGGGESINAYLQWAAAEAQSRYGITVKHVKVNDPGEYIKRVESELASGRTQNNGSVDLVWINGENFKRMKESGMLTPAWVSRLPHWALVDTAKPVTEDFSIPTDGQEAPWGTAQLTLIYDRAVTQSPPTSAAALLLWARQHPGTVTYPRPPNFHGVTFLKQLLLELTPDRAALRAPVDRKRFAEVTKPLWDYLQALHPLLWRKGQNFPAGIAEMHRMLADRELSLSLTFNPLEAANLITTGQFPPTVASYGFRAGMIGNVHFLAIPVNATAREAAMVFVNFLLSPEAQARKADIKVWGDGTVLDLGKVEPRWRTALQPSGPGAPTEAIPFLPEPHASWVEALEQEWLRRFGR